MKSDKEKNPMEELCDLPSTLPPMKPDGTTPQLRVIDPNRPLWEQDERFFNPFAEIPENLTWAYMGDRPALPKEGMILIDAKPKQGKSFCAYALMIPLLTGKDFGSVKPRETPNRVIVFDSEMSRGSLKMRYTAFREAIGDNADRLLIVPMLDKPDSDKWPIVMDMVETYNPDVVVIDHISSFVVNYNDPVEAKQTMNNCNRIKATRTLITIIHQNKSKEDTNARGALGSLLNDGQCESYTATKKHGIFTLTPKSARDSETDNAATFSFAPITDENKTLTGFTTAEEVLKRQREAKAEEWRKDLRLIFGDNVELSRTEIKQRIMERQGLEKTSADNKITEAVNCGALAKTHDSHRAPYKITPSSTIPPEAEEDEKWEEDF